MNAVAVSVWEQGLAVCKATKLVDGGYYVALEHVHVRNAADAGDIIAALRGSRVPSGVNSLVRAKGVLQAFNVLVKEGALEAITSTDNVAWCYSTGL
jgi:hypothetical protein